MRCDSVWFGWLLPARCVDKVESKIHTSLILSWKVTCRGWESVLMSRHHQDPNCKRNEEMKGRINKIVFILRSGSEGEFVRYTNFWSEQYWDTLIHSMKPSILPIVGRRIWMLHDASYSHNFCLPNSSLVLLDNMVMTSTLSRQQQSRIVSNHPPLSTTFGSKNHTLCRNNVCSSCVFLDLFSLFNATTRPRQQQQLYRQLFDILFLFS